MKDLSLIQIIENLKSKKTNPKEVWNYFNARIEKFDKRLWCFNYINKDWLNENIDSTLAWVPIWVKDIFCEIWIPTTCASIMLQDFKPPYDATVIKKLKDAGMSSIWKLNMDEFAMWSTTETSAGITI